MNPLIRTENLGRTYSLDSVSISILRHINLTIDRSEMLAIVGPSGCGKSTLMHLLGLLDTPSSGQIYFGGEPVGDLGDGERARLRAQKIGFVFQQFNLLKRFSALENVLLPVVYSGRSRGAETRGRELLQRVGLGDRVLHQVGRLSGGEQQRVAIARALINDPEVILADEPTGNLDSRSGAEVLSLLKKLSSEGHTIIVVTHDQTVADACTRLIKMKDGEIVV